MFVYKEENVLPTLLFFPVTKIVTPLVRNYISDQIAYITEEAHECNTLMLLS
jgi:hypothetical protein